MRERRDTFSALRKILAQTTTQQRQELSTYVDTKSKTGQKHNEESRAVTRQWKNPGDTAESSMGERAANLRTHGEIFAGWLAPYSPCLPIAHMRVKGGSRIDEDDLEGPDDSWRKVAASDAHDEENGEEDDDVEQQGQDSESYEGEDLLEGSAEQESQHAIDPEEEWIPRDILKKRTRKAFPALFSCVHASSKFLQCFWSLLLTSSCTHRD